MAFDLNDRKQVAQLVAVGLRAKLSTESIITGVRYIALDINPDAPVHLVHDPRYPEIPSLRKDIPDKLDRVINNLADVDFAGIADSVQATVGRADRLLASPDLARAMASIDEVTASVRGSVTDIARTARGLAPAITELTEATTEARKMIAPGGRLSLQLDTTLREIQLTARSLRRLTDQLNRDPGAIVRGGKQ